MYQFLRGCVRALRGGAAVGRARVAHRGRRYCSVNSKKALELIHGQIKVIIATMKRELCV